MANDSRYKAAGTSAASLTMGGLKPAPELDDEADKVLGARIAGGLYLAIAIISMPFLVTGDVAKMNPLGLIVDLFVCAALLKGNLGVRGFAIFRIVAGSLIFGAMAIAGGDFATIAAQLAIMVFMLLLLVGVPRQGRRRLAAAIGATVLAMTVVGTVFEFTDAGPAAVAGEQREIPGGVVHGVDAAWELTVSDAFKLRDRATARAENPAVDAWLVDNRHDMHVMTVCEAMPEGMQDETMVGNVVDAMTGANRVLSERTQPVGVGFRRVARLEFLGDVAFSVDINVSPTTSCTVYAFTGMAMFNERKAELATVLDSFRFKTP